MRKEFNIIDFLTQVPWWISVCLSATFYFLLKYVIPYFEQQSSLVNEVHLSLGPVFAPVVALALLTPATFSLFRTKRSRKLHELRQEIHAIKELSWEELKERVAGAYSSAGYLILGNDPFTSDQDIDMVMRKSANLYILQCRYWRNRKIGLREVKNLHALMLGKQASGIFLLTTGVFSSEARRYALGRPINLVDGIELVELLASSGQKQSPDTTH